MKKERNSIFELIRIIAMLFIVIYHLFMLFIAPKNSNSFYYAIQMPLHIGVILFVLISGYWGIKCSMKGALKLISMVAFYFLPIALLTDISNSGGVNKQILKDCLFFSHTPYWFIRTYFCLYLFSPVLNKYLMDITRWNRLVLIITLSFISIYLGTSEGDPSVADGKNLANFSLLYVLGNTLHHYEKEFKKWSNRILIPIYLVLNLTLILGYCFFADTLIAKIIWKISFPYCSPILIINAMLFFIIVTKYQIQSKIINYVASSMFAVYLIHCQPFIEKNITGSIMAWVLTLTDNIFYISAITILLGMCIIAVCVMIDKCLSPLWMRISNIAIFFEAKSTYIRNKYFIN